MASQPSTSLFSPVFEFDDQQQLSRIFMPEGDMQGFDMRKEVDTILSMIKHGDHKH